MRTAIKRHCRRRHNCDSTYLQKGQEPSDPKYLHWDELLKSPATASLTRMPKNYKKPVEEKLELIQPAKESLKKPKARKTLSKKYFRKKPERVRPDDSEASDSDVTSSQAEYIADSCGCEPMLYPKKMRLKKRELKIIKKQALKCRQWEIFQQILINRSTWWMIRCNRFAVKNTATKKKLAEAELRIKSLINSPANDVNTKIRLGVFEKYYMQHKEEIVELKAALQDERQKEHTDAKIKVDTIIPNEDQIMQWELNQAQAENQRLRDESERKDQITNRI